MALFGREAQAATPAPASGPREAAATGKPRQATLIANGCKVTGSITGNAELLIDGEFEGELQVNSSVTVGADGKVHGEISARTVRVGGKVLGNVRSVDRVEVMASGSLEGDVTTPRLVIAEGAYFKGKVEMTGQAKPEDRRPTPLPAPAQELRK